MNDSSTAFDTVVIGLGQTGLSCARHLQRLGLRFAVTDNRDLPPQLAQFRKEFPDVTLATGSFDEGLLENAREILLSPGISLQEPAIARALARGTPVLGDVELFCRTAAAPIIAVTGSNGKSTVVSLVHAMALKAGLASQLGGNIGTPVLDLLAADQADLYVLELSSFQLELTRSMNARAAVVLNISADHMDRYDSLASYTQAKAAVYNGTGVMVINLDDPLVNAMREPQRSWIGFSNSAPGGDNFGLQTVRGVTWLMHGQRRLIQAADLRLRGQHNHLNALAALALGQAAGLPMPVMLDALRAFEGLPHRCQRVRVLGGVDWINDSKGTNVGASCAAIESLAGENNLILIAGGEGKGADFSPLIAAMQDRVRVVITLGRDGPAIAGLLPPGMPHQPVTTMEEAVQHAAEHARPGDTVLLSPACASLDMFTDYAERGRCFAAAVHALGDA
jgi:UDP-N-acetylmuramoylalanine--D-glutamate ligase